GEGARGIAQVKPFDRQAPPLSSENDRAFRQRGFRLQGVLDLKARQNRLATGGQRLDHDRRSSKDIDHDGDSSSQASGRDQAGQQMDRDACGFWHWGWTSLKSPLEGE